ncbi:hypothetical protein K470DRAFT_256032 [Piedraia hortae CBS 480.64]|uniref:O-acyltransferase n=1 Tax=Piedraia hortae CBS 480.64 TaxID=1314780 RepID=A0A6A7C571_9PEZI|nr:hypothetical protein K470DRAFT_256032 [Piedraia hortae CBS 480.64]
MAEDAARQVIAGQPSSRYKHVFAIHTKVRPSCLTHTPDAVAPSFVGFRNLMGLMLVASNLRLMLENFRKYGFLVTLSGAPVRPDDWAWFVIMYALTPAFLFVAYAIEAAAAEYARGIVGAHKREEKHEDDGALFSTWGVVAICHASNATIMLGLAIYVVYMRILNPSIAIFTITHAIIVWLKVSSYAFTNRDLRHAYVNGQSDVNLPELYKQCPYPRNITLRNLCYFWWAPTLVYQPVYPSAPERRWGFIAKRACEFLILNALILIAVQQYALPLLRNSFDDVSQLKVINVVERVLKLSTISLVCWLAGFFAIFQSFLNLLAELLKFGDREFYSDWWNSADLRTYWTSWNKPVSHFLRRHVYTPMVGRGVPRNLAQLITFTFSGLLHEVLVGVPTHNVLGVAFLGMLLQIPLIYLTDRLSRGERGHNEKLMGNLIFWISFCIFGQPLAVLIYFCAWQAKYGGEITTVAVQ